MNIAVLGSGNGGCAVAFDYAQSGHRVRLFDFEQFPSSIEAINCNGGISCEGVLQGTCSLEYAGHDIAKALDGADLIYVVGPAYSTSPFAKACKPYLKKGQIVIVCPGSSGGAIEFKRTANLQLEDTDIVVAETATLPYAVRILTPGRIRIFNKLGGGILFAALPASMTAMTLRTVWDVYPGMKEARNVFQTSLQNGNPVIHPAITLLNAALIERTAGNFDFYQEGVTPAVGRLMEAVDRERIALGRALDLCIVPDPELGVIQGYMTEATYDRGFVTAPGFAGVRAPQQLDYRYFHEDIGYGLVFLHSLGRQIGVETPVVDAIITLVSTLMGRDYLTESKRSMESLGLDAYSRDELLDLVG